MKIDAETMKKQVILHLPYVLFLLVFAKLGEAVRLAPGADASQKLLGLSEGFALAFQSMWPGAAMDWLIGLCGAAIMRLAVYLRGKDAKKYRKNVEYGSARWGNKTDIAPFMDPKPENNIILTQSEGLMLNGRPKNPANARNKNVLVVGGSGSGKTRFFIKPNLMQMHSSYVVTDPKGTVLVECGKMLQRGTPKLDKDGNPVRNEKGKIIYEPYKIRVFNTINFQKSMHFNPFAYIHSEKDILKIVTTLIANTKGEGKAGDDFWVKAETLLYTALIGYIYYEAPANEQNFATLVEMLNAMEVREDDESFKNAVDLLFDALEQKDPDHFALRQYKKYKLAAGKTAKSILISCASRLAPFDIKEVREITMYDELDLDMLGDERTALFLIMSDTDGTFAFLISLIYSILFNRLCERADDVYGGRLPIHVRCLIDEAANIGQIPNLERLMATIRSREISACLVLQAQSQLKALYKDNMDTIIGNCDASLFLGGKEETTLKSWNSLLGKETIDLYNTSVTKGNQESHGQNFQKLGKDLMSVDELAVMDGGKCLLQIRGVRPFLSRKYDITKVVGTEIALTATPNKGYHFKEWQVESPAGLVITNNKFTMPDSDVGVKAIFEKDAPPAPTEFIVTFDGNGGTPSVGSMTTTDQKLTSLPSASRSGSYSFDGWYTEKSGGTKITTATVFSANTTVYAHWTYTGGGGGGYNPPVTYYTLRFETGGSDIPSVRETYNTYIDLTKHVPTWRGHTFIGWYTERSLMNKVSGVYLTKDMTVYAGWRVDENPGTGANPFTDVSEKDWFYGDVMFVYENGLMLGTSKTLFSPHGTATRGMMATILWRMEGSPAPKGKNSFTDVEAGKRYADAITWTAENGIFAGYGKDKFGPDDPITREQLAAIFYRYADYKGYDLTVKGNLDKFKDADKITDYAKTAMQWAVGSGLVKGKSGNLLDPQGTATRAEIAAMLHRFIEKYELVQGKAPGGLMGWIDPKRLQIPKTGDSSVLGLWGISLCTSLAGCLALTAWKIRRRE